MPRRLVSLLGLIGWALSPAQTCVGQVAPLGELPVAAKPFREAMLAQLERQSDHAAAWRLADAIGWPLAALQWDLFHRASGQRRLPLLIAADLAGGGNQPERLLRVVETAGSDRAGLEERIEALLLLALGPSQSPGLGDPWPRILKGQREPSPALLVAGYAAVSRLPVGADSGPPIPDDDAGVLAAALLAGCRGADKDVAAAFANPAEPPPHAELVWRGYCLGPLLRDAGDLAADKLRIERARRVLQQPGPQFEAARAAAALLLAHAGVDPGMDHPPWQLLQLLASTPQGARRQVALLEPVPKPLVESPGRLCAEYALFQPLSTVVRDLQKYLGNAEARRIVALALAYRLLADDAATVKELAMPVPLLPEWFWVQWACGEVPLAPLGKDGAPLPSCDAALDRALPLARDGRLPRAVAQRLLEAALWRNGWHPGLGLQQARLELLRDLLLTGSYPGSKYQPSVPHEKRYLPQGLQRNAPMFAVLIELFDYVNQPTLPLPRECRLR